jgi:hypothetical protein
METEAKYYIPDISEFFVGFEFEVWGNPAFEKENWIKKIIGYNSKLEYVDIPEVDKYLESLITGIDKFRVKYLDAEDIESLGFKKNIVDNNTFECGGIKIHLKSNCYEVIIVQKHEEWELTAVPTKIGEYYSKMFEGTVKNKSELKKVLQMIGVI